MEHLLLGENASTLSIPYLSTEDYDGGDFLTYPDRMGWDVSTWRWSTEEDGFDLNNRTIEEMAAFLQTWLFFGLLESLIDIPVPKNEFIRQDEEGNVFITTSSLPKYLKEWEQLHNQLQEPEKETADDNAYSYLTEASTVNDMLTYLLFYGESLSGADPLKQTLFIQTILAEALNDTRIRVLQGRDARPVPRYDTFLREQMITSGWCISTVEYMQEKFPLQAQAFAFSLGSVRALQDHSTCKEDVSTGCMLGVVDQNFKPKHVEAGCSCDPVSPPIGNVVQILRNGQIPLIRILRSADDPGEFELAVDGIELGNNGRHDVHPFFAISHVWADGLGNPNANALPKCQIAKLERLSQSLEGTLVYELSQSRAANASKSAPISFWLDTLCIPVQEEHQSLRDFSIQMMQEIYKSAGGVLVLDPDLETLSNNARPAEVLSRLLTSGWRARLWTYQEGMLATELLIPGQDCCFKFDSEDDLFAQDKSKCDISERILLETLWWIYSDLIWNCVSKSDIVENPARATRMLLKSASHRRTTRPGDETICIATFLGIDPTPLLKVSADNRMPVLLSLLPTVTAYILFTHGARLQTKGFRWAPLTFLSPYGLQDSDQVSLPLTYVPDVSNATARIPVPNPYLNPHGLGLAVFFPALLLDPVPDGKPVPEVFSVRTPNNGTYLVEARDTGTRIAWDAIALHGMDRSAILLSNPESGRVSLLVEVLGETTEGEVIARWKAIVTVDKMGDFLEDASIDKAEERCLEGDYRPFGWWVID